ncbi:MAG: 30S ribosomal protein S9 [Dehalococcoidia bacterium]|nr:30S ribosomal protein S9 [Dehalococcoidia bacterium]MDW8119375.1 30S ribosomal protein S9 [Chloroflexota bacterium]
MTTTSPAPSSAGAQAEAPRYFYALGKRKTAVAQVRLYPGGNTFLINDKPFETVFPLQTWQATVLEPFRVTETLGKFAVVAKVRGGGISAWADALRHGIARALVVADPAFKAPLRQKGLLTRDPRVKERKKYGLKRARRAPQYSKR